METFFYYGVKRDPDTKQVIGVPELENGMYEPKWDYGNILVYEGTHFLVMVNLFSQIARVWVSGESNVRIEKLETWIDTEDLESYNDMEHTQKFYKRDYSLRSGFGLIFWFVDERGDYRDPDGFGGGSNDFCAGCIFDSNFNVVYGFDDFDNVEYLYDHSFLEVFENIMKSYQESSYDKCLTSNASDETYYSQFNDALFDSFIWEEYRNLPYNSIESIALSTAFYQNYGMDKMRFRLFGLLNMLLCALDVDLSESDPNYIMKHIIYDCYCKDAEAFWFKPHFAMVNSFYPAKEYLFELTYVLFYCIKHWIESKDKHYKLQNDDIKDIMKTKVHVPAPSYFMPEGMFSRGQSILPTP